MKNDEPGETVTFTGGMSDKKRNIGGRSVELGGTNAARAARPAWNPEPYKPEDTIPYGSGHAATSQTCVGWLLAVRGPNKGRSYEIFPGQNSIGRSKECAVCITADGAVSATQCIVGYDPVGKEYFICGSDRSSAITRLNGKRLHGELPLELGAVITLSDDGKKPDGKVVPGTVLRFVPACDESFSWDMTED